MSQKPIVRLKPENHGCLKMAAVAFGMPLNALADEAIQEWIKKNKRRIESATGRILTTQIDGPKAGA